MAMTREELEKVSYLEYCRKEREILDSLGRISNRCDGADCNCCPLCESIFECNDLSDEAIKERLEIVMNYKKKEINKKEIDWSKVPKDTLIRVWENGREDCKVNRYFSHYFNGVVYAFQDGRTSFTGCNCTGWDNAELVDKGE